MLSVTILMLTIITHLTLSLRGTKQSMNCCLMPVCHCNERSLSSRRRRDLALHKHVASTVHRLLRARERWLTSQPLLPAALSRKRHCSVTYHVFLFNKDVLFMSYQPDSLIESIKNYTASNHFPICISSHLHICISTSPLPT
jgi:hypothetical protein